MYSSRPGGIGFLGLGPGLALALGASLRAAASTDLPAGPGGLPPRERGPLPGSLEAVFEAGCAEPAPSEREPYRLPRAVLPPSVPLDESRLLAAQERRARRAARRVAQSVAGGAR